MLSAIAVAVATAIIYPLKSVAPVASLSVVYLPAVLFVSVYWGLALGLVTSLASAAAFNFFHIPPLHRFTIADGRNWVALAAFVMVAAVVSGMAELARNRALDAERRRAEADLAAGLARELLAGERTVEALGATARRLSQALTLPSAAIELGPIKGDPRRLALALRSAGGEQIATLLVSRKLPSEMLERLGTQVVPSLEVIVAIALHRDAMQAEAVETAALRRSDELKTALLRAVSHDLRSPVTSIVTAGHALGVPTLTEDERHELSAAVVEEGERLSALIDKLLDLSRLQAGRATPHADVVSIEESLLAARERVGASAAQVRLILDEDLPPIVADAVQLEQVFVNLLENACRFAGGMPVVVLVRRVASRIIVRVVDQGPGVSPGDRERIFEPFYRGDQTGAARWKGSGLGLAIARGFLEANGGTISVDSLPGQGASFVVELPLERPPRVTA